MRRRWNLRAMTDEDWVKKGTSPEGKPVTAWRMLRAMLEHEAHHRGQMYVYLGSWGCRRIRCTR